MGFKKVFSVIISLMLLVEQGFAGHDDGVSQYYYNGMPGCGCFYHCTCFSSYLSGFPEYFDHPKRPEDKVWHEFMKKFLLAVKVGPIIPNLYVQNVLEGSNECRYVCLLSEYLNATNTLKKAIEKARDEHIEWYKEYYKNPKDQKDLMNNIDRLNSQASSAFRVLSTIPETIVPLYKKVLEDCNHNGIYNMAAVYTRGLIALLEGNSHQSLKDIVAFVDLAEKNGKQKLLTSEVFQKQGEAFLEVGLYHQSIEALNQAISKDPKNLEAYFQRASAYFEIGDFELSLNDYMNSKKSSSSSSYNLVSKDFVDSFARSALQGSFDAACDFVPSLCHTAYGLGECLWAFGEHPVDSVRDLANASYEITEHVIDYLKSVDKEKLDHYAEELVRLYENFGQLNDNEKGELIGYTLGKYGVEIYAGAVILKGVSAYKRLKEANAICNFESISISASSKEKIIRKGVEQSAKRSLFFKETKIHWGQQNKHVIGKHNYEPGKSIFEHPDAESLLSKYAGTGSYKVGEVGQPGYREVVDFREHIGLWKNETGLSLPTTKGTIHYGKKGAHIVPERPDYELWGNYGKDT